MTPSSQPKRRAPGAQALILAAGGALALAVQPAAAQLRGAVTEQQVSDDLRGRVPLQHQPSALRPAAVQQEYAPGSRGAVDDPTNQPDTSGTLFPAAETDAAAFGEEEPARRTGVRQRPSDETTASVPPAPAEEPTGPANPRAERITNEEDAANLRMDPENVRVEPIEEIDITPEESPFAAPGLRLGTFTVRPTLEQGLTWTSNANYSPTPKPALLSETSLRLNAVSDWSRHSAMIDAFGTFRKSVSGEQLDEPSAGIDATFNLDIRDGLRGLARLGYDFRKEAADSPVQLPVTVSRPLLHTIDGEVAVEKDLGKLRFRLGGEVERLDYDDARLGGGGVLSQRERNSTLMTGTARVGYQVSPAVTPFVEAEYGRRVHDLRLDSNGYARSSDRAGLRAGVALDLGEKLVGEISAGWINEQFDDNRLASISGLSTEANLAWSPQRGTTITAKASTTVEGTTTAGESGSLLYSGSIDLARELRSNLTLGASVGASLRDYASNNDRDLTWRGEASLTWWMNRYAGLTGRYRFEMLDSTLPNRDTTTNSVYLGVTLRR